MLQNHSRSHSHVKKKKRSCDNHLFTPTSFFVSWKRKKYERALMLFIYAVPRVNLRKKKKEEKENADLLLGERKALNAQASLAGKSGANRAALRP